ncbi:hypothetical protein ACHAXR_007685 [Thalassiosira sp. AJA248-18]
MATAYFLQICLILLMVVVIVVTGYTNSPGIFHGGAPTRQQRTIHWPSSLSGGPVPVEKEIQLLMSGTLLRRGEFGPLYGSRALELELECAELGLAFHQALSIRKQLMLRKLLKEGSRKLKDEKKMNVIIRKFEQQHKPLLEIAQEYDLPPVSIFRAIMAPRVLSANPRFTGLDRKRPAGRIIQSIINEADENHVDDFLTDWEVNELRTAKENDVVGYQTNCTAAKDWEDSIYSFLDEQGINYATEESLRLQGCETIGTPDCLLLDDLFINGKQIKWLEFKSFYASGLKENNYFTKKAVSNQIEKYDAEFGRSGAVILKHGFSEKISQKYPSTLFLDGGPLFSESEYL